MEHAETRYSDGLGPLAGRIHNLKMIIRVSGAAVAALALVAGTSAFGFQPAARQSHARQVSARQVSARHTSPVPSTGPMIGAALPASAAAAAATANGSISNIKTMGSNNWAGYAVTKKGGKFRKVTANFHVPHLDCARTPGETRGTYSSEWVGLDGFASETVEQDGISADCAPGTSKPMYTAWHEIFPRPEVATKIVIRSGDSITATVAFSPTTHNFRMSLTDNTNHHHFTVFRKCAATSCPRSSAEFISEAPGINGRLASLADYRTERFVTTAITSSAGKTGGLSSKRWTPTRIIQVGHKTQKVIAIPTVLHGRSFTNHWHGEK